MNIKYMAIAMVAILVLGATSVAHEDATGIVKERMDAMVAIANSMKTIAQMIKGTSSYDQELIKSSVQTIKEYSGSRLTRMFPEGSLQEVSEARNEIWSNWDLFSELANRMEFMANELELVVDRDPSEREMLKPDKVLNQAFKNLANTCAQCHQEFRISK